MTIKLGYLRQDISIVMIVSWPFMLRQTLANSSKIMLSHKDIGLNLGVIEFTNNVEEV
jgi:hypothetical protein